ncbi:transposase [Streptomyces sp. NPDC006267]|uniref:transposase n=1 Tax=Streptomyces sp. NPDC006267 TaxID=3157173 RepID=UPI0033AD1F16
MDDEEELLGQFLPVGGSSPYPEHPREQFEGVVWKFRSGAQWRETPPEFGGWQAACDRFVRWRGAGAFQPLAPMDGMIVEADRRGQTDLSLVSGGSTVDRAHHAAAGVRVDEEVLSSRGGRPVPTTPTSTKTATPSNDQQAEGMARHRDPLGSVVKCHAHIRSDARVTAASWDWGVLS